jgi:trans-aconitate methyltransferase
VTSGSNRDDVSRVEQAWDEAALGYDAYFGPRFAPFLGAAIGALMARREQLPSGAIVVPCVGPGRELPALARAFSERHIAASDLSTGMVKRASERVAALSNVSVTRADATQLAPPNGGVAAVLSVFGLQLLPNPATALASWLELLSPRGLAVIVYWPREAETVGPFHSMRQLLRHAGLADGTWEAELVPSALSVGAHVLVDSPLCFEITYDDARTMWQGLTHLGPLRGLMLARGAEFVAQLGEEFEAELPKGPLSHTPAARLLILERA